MLICFFTLPVWAGEARWPKPNLDKSYTAPFTESNSTFSSDSTLPHPHQKRAWEHGQELQNRIIPKLDSGWLKERLAAVQEPRTTDVPVTVAKPTQPDSPQRTPADQTGVQWKPLIAQSLTFLWIEHSFRLLTEQGTRDDLRGPFFKDWFRAVRSTRGWRDGDPFLVNYIGHPMQGAVTGYMYVHNDPKSIRLEADFSKAYFKSRLKAMLFSTVYSTQFELGPISEASIGNVGIRPTHTSNHPAAFVDLVITPTLGTAWMMGEDMLDRYVIKRMEDHVDNRVIRLLVRGFLNPSRSFANVLRGRYPWNRDGRRL